MAKTSAKPKISAEELQLAIDAWNARKPKLPVDDQGHALSWETATQEQRKQINKYWRFVVNNPMPR